MKKLNIKHLTEKINFFIIMHPIFFRILVAIPLILLYKYFSMPFLALEKNPIKQDETDENTMFIILKYLINVVVVIGAVYYYFTIKSSSGIQNTPTQEPTIFEKFLNSNNPESFESAIISLIHAMANEELDFYANLNLFNDRVPIGNIAYIKELLFKQGEFPYKIIPQSDKIFFNTIFHTVQSLQEFYDEDKTKRAMVNFCVVLLVSSFLSNQNIQLMGTAKLRDFCETSWTLALKTLEIDEDYNY